MKAENKTAKEFAEKNPYLGQNRQQLNAAGYSMQEVESYLAFQLDWIHRMQTHLQDAFTKLEEDEKKSVQHNTGTGAKV